MTIYYAVVGGNATTDEPLGLVRRTGATDEALQRDFGWTFTPAIVEWERGDFADELVEVSYEQATRIIEYFRSRWQ